MESVNYMMSKLKELSDDPCCCSDDAASSCDSCRATDILNQSDQVITKGYNEIIKSKLRVPS